MRVVKFMVLVNKLFLNLVIGSIFVLLCFVVVANTNDLCDHMAAY